MSDKPRDKLSDAVERGDFYFQRPPKPGEEKTFEELFPTVREMEIEVKENGSSLRRPRSPISRSSSSPMWSTVEILDV